MRIRIELELNNNRMLMIKYPIIIFILFHSFFILLNHTFNHFSTNASTLF